MSYAERAYFDGDHCQHVAAREEYSRVTRRKAQAARLLGRSKRNAAND